MWELQGEKSQKGLISAKDLPIELLEGLCFYYEIKLLLLQNDVYIVALKRKSSTTSFLH